MIAVSALAWMQAVRTVAPSMLFHAHCGEVAWWPQVELGQATATQPADHRCSCYPSQSSASLLTTQQSSTSFASSVSLQVCQNCDRQNCITYSRSSAASTAFDVASHTGGTNGRNDKHLHLRTLSCGRRRTVCSDRRCASGSQLKERTHWENSGPLVRTPPKQKSLSNQRSQSLSSS